MAWHSTLLFSAAITAYFLQLLGLHARAANDLVVMGVVGDEHVGSPVPPV